MTTTLPLIRIVDDDEELRNSQKMLLASVGWSVKTYESALAFLSDDELTRPGCLILDVRILQVVKRSLKAQKRSRHFS